VVVTASGLKRTEKCSGYAGTVLTGDELITNAINPVASLRGTVSGVAIACADCGLFGAADFPIRGASSLRGGRQTLYVVSFACILSPDLSGSCSSVWDSNGA
jgi:hypothetical protein